MSKEKKILEIIAEIIEVELDELSLSMELDEDNWDSLAVVSFISEIDSEFEQVLSPSEVNSVKSVSDLIQLIK
ncbi:phosphopantetheine-binding protein [Vibrio sp. T20]|uniref:phosphopantetheine-binding protein n=1 Tax=Vibrio sp. T20 TaxID=2588450 RepID=UPI0011B3C0C3|nr:phosphopantetheine-binding protein [Vibrio sp. T20]